jgi:hypothetical protein
MEQATLTPVTRPAAGLIWTTQRSVGDDRLDETHAEFVDPLNTVRATPTEQQLPLYRAFLDHTVEHFAQEDRWMLAWLGTSNRSALTRPAKRWPIHRPSAQPACAVAPA